jgi:BioD-like phosphotransacetylase family protein
MITLVITSLTGNAGKTMLSAGLAQYWLNAGQKVGYFQPVAGDSGNQPDSNRDTAFMQQLLGLIAPPASESPDKPAELPPPPSFSAAAQGKDVVIIEGLLKDVSTLPEFTAAKILVVQDYSSPLTKSLPEYQKLGSRLLGIVVNKIPRKDISRKQASIVDEITRSGLPCLGVIPEDRILMALSVADLAAAVQGKILNNPEKSTELVENIMMGNSIFDRAAGYLRKDNKAVLLWGERPGYRKAALSNMQLAVLQSSTRCIVLSTNGAPIPAVAQKAGEKQVPLISAPGTLPEIVAAIEKGFCQLKFNQEKKLPRLAEILKESLNLQQLEANAGIG